MNKVEKYKEDHCDQLCEWVMDKKFDDMNRWAEGILFEDNYEEILEDYMLDNMDELWEEYFKEFKIKL